VRSKDAAKKKNRRDKNVDMEKLADGLQKLSEDDLLHVVTLVHDNKTSETYTKNDVESELVCTTGMGEVLTNYRWRVPRRSLHIARFVGEDAVGLHRRKG
jgi:transcription initiation factor IIF auxiliary subunit